MRFTGKSDALFAVALGWPQTGNWLVKSLGDAKVKSVSMLGDKPVQWSLAAEGLRLEAPASQSGKYAYTFKIAM